jgi:mono/diheme cytochrome c family protein
LTRGKTFLIARSRWLRCPLWPRQPGRPSVAAGWASFALGVAASAVWTAPALADDPVSGANIFTGRCAVCHGPEAAGIPGSFPSLHEQIVAFAATPAGRDYLVMVVTTGLMGDLKVGGASYRGVMPAQSGLSEAEVAAVLSYLGSDRGKIASPPALSAADVAQARLRHPDQSAQNTRALRPTLPDP